MKKRTHFSRRSFIKKLGGTTALVAGGSVAFGSNIVQLKPAEKPQVKYAANDKVRVACIGAGIMGFNNIQTALKVSGVELAAVCDLYDGRLIRSKEVFGNSIFTTRNYQEILDRKDIDAVIVATTDHWHERIAVDAMEKGKAVYCEKPMVHKIEQGHTVVKAQKKTGKPLQVGSQRLSSIVYEKAKQLYKAGEIGELNMVEAFMDRFDALGAWQYSIPPDASKQTIDWNTFLGNAPKVAFDPVRFFRWRNYQDYGTGVPGDLFVHLLTGIHFITGSEGPNRITTSGGLHYWKDGRDVPDLMISVYDYPKTEVHPAFTAMMRVNFADGSGGGSLIRLVGSEGEMRLHNNSVTVKRQKLPAAPGYGGWDSFHTFPEAVQKEFVKQYEAKYPQGRAEIESPKELTFSAPKGYSEHYDHHMVFFNAVRNGTPIVEDALFGLRAAGPALAANVSYFEKKPILWNPGSAQIVKA